MTPPEYILDSMKTYADMFGRYADYLVTIDLDGEVITELLILDTDSEFVWLNDWWEGQIDVHLLGFLPISQIKIYATSVEIGCPVFGPDPVLVTMTSIGKYRLEVLTDGET